MNACGLAWLTTTRTFGGEDTHMRYLIIIERGDAGYGGSVPDVPGVFAAGDSPQEVERLLAEALAEHLAILRADGEPVPAPTYTHAYVDVDVDTSASSVA